MEYLPDEMLVMLLCEFWNVERCSVEAEITEHPFVSMSLVCKRFSFVCRQYFPTSYHAERMSKLFRIRIASSIRKSAIWQRKCFKWPWIKKCTEPTRRKHYSIDSETLRHSEYNTPYRSDTAMAIEVRVAGIRY